MRPQWGFADISAKVLLGDIITQKLSGLQAGLHTVGIPGIVTDAKLGIGFIDAPTAAKPNAARAANRLEDLLHLFHAASEIIALFYCFAGQGQGLFHQPDNRSAPVRPR